MLGAQLLIARDLVRQSRRMGQQVSDGDLRESSNRELGQIANQGIVQCEALFIEERHQRADCDRFGDRA